MGLLAAIRNREDVRRHTQIDNKTTSKFMDNVSLGLALFSLSLSPVAQSAFLAYLSLRTITKVGSPIGSGVVIQSGKPRRYTITATYMRNIFPVSVIYDAALSFVTLSSRVKQYAL